jgi:hypothetical protein
MKELILLITFHEYKTLEEVVELFWDTPIDDMRSSQMGGFDESGDEIEVSFDQIFSGMQEVGCWGFCVTDTRDIHFWIDRERVERGEVLAFFSHEIAHIIDQEHDDDVEREMFAELISAVTLAAVRATELCFLPKLEPSTTFGSTN